jgi:adenylate kinase family enzyme
MKKKIRNRYQEYNENGAFNGLLQQQGNFFIVNGIGSITEITERVSS